METALWKQRCQASWLRTMALVVKSPESSRSLGHDLVQSLDPAGPLLQLLAPPARPWSLAGSTRTGVPSRECRAQESWRVDHSRRPPRLSTPVTGDGDDARGMKHSSGSRATPSSGSLVFSRATGPSPVSACCYVETVNSLVVAFAGVGLLSLGAGLCLRKALLGGSVCTRTCPASRSRANCC